MIDVGAKKGTTLTSNPLKESLKSNTMKYIAKITL